MAQHSSAASKTHPKKQTLTAMVTEGLREKIIFGDIKGGEPLKQDALANQFNVSHIPVREALLALESEGLVTFVPHKGAVVKEVSIDEVDELFSLRALLECDILKHAFPNLTDTDFDYLDKILSSFETLLLPGADTSSWGYLNWELHSTLYLPANRGRELAFIENLHTLSKRYLRFQVSIEGSYHRADREHRELVELCKNGDQRGALKLLKEHLENTRDQLLSNLQF